MSETPTDAAPASRINRLSVALGLVSCLLAALYVARTIAPSWLADDRASAPAATTPVPVPPQPERPGKKALRVLFIGNSYTSYNRLQDQIRGLAAAGKAARPLWSLGLTPGGATLEKQWQTGKALELIKSRRWDVVVLQGQSVEPIYQPDVFVRYALKFAEAIRAAGARPALYMTWPRRKGHAHYERLGIPGPREMDAAMERIFARLAREGEALLVPVGRAWVLALKRDAALPLYEADGSHPTWTGTYLAACVFYRSLYGKTPAGLSFKPAGVSEAHARLLRDVASKVPLR